eukprot:6065509-Amphidinium_carterae.1
MSNSEAVLQTVPCQDRKSTMLLHIVCETPSANNTVVIVARVVRCGSSWGPGVYWEEASVQLDGRIHQTLPFSGPARLDKPLNTAFE